MEGTYTCTITTLEGEEVELTLNRLTMRHGLQLEGKDISNATETLIDLAAPGALDIISPASLQELVGTIMEKEKSFFAQMAKLLPSVKRQRTRPKRTKKGKK